MAIVLRPEPAATRWSQLGPRARRARVQARAECVSGLASDGELLRRIVAGEGAALGMLYDRHARTMTSLGVRILGPRSEVEDILHDVFLEVWRRAADYDRRRGSVKTWLLVRMRSRCIDLTRSRLPRRIEGDRLDVVEVRYEPQADASRLRALVVALPAPQRLVMELGYFRGLSISEIAVELAVPVGTVKSRLSAALARLRIELGVVRAGDGQSREPA